jgi:glycosyltransferase involved in cell wall biosynthesis
MKITITGPVYPYRGGIAHYTSHLAQKLVSIGHETQVISFKRQYPTWLYPGVSDKDPSAEPLSVSAEYLLDPIYPWTWLQTTKTIASFKPQIIAIQWWTTFWSPAFSMLSWMLKKKGMRVVYMIHNVLPHEEKIWDRWLAHIALSAGNGFIVHTQREKERLQKLLPNAKSQVCPIPTYDSLAQSRMSKTKARESLGLPQNKPLLLSFGIVRPYKGLNVLLEALALLVKRNVDFHLLVAGEFWDDKSNYIRQIERLSLAEYIQLEDRYLPDEEVATIFSAADVLVAPYIGGTQSAVASWGLGFGIPLIVSDKVADGISNQKKHLVTVTPSGDHHQLAKAIEELIEGKGEKQPLLQTSTKQDSSWDDLIQALISFDTMNSNP